MAANPKGAISSIKRNDHNTLLSNLGSVPEGKHTMTKSRKRMIGAAAGAGLCAIARLLVVIGYCFYLTHWGSQTGKSSELTIYWFALISALIGIPIGALAGRTCEPSLGAVIGGALSGGTCFGLFVLPGEFMLALVENSESKSAEVWEIFFAFVPMVFAGAWAGGIGAAIGRNAGSVSKAGH